MAPLDVSHFHDDARTLLLRLLDSVVGKKNLVLQKALVPSIETLVTFSKLQEHGVDRVFFLENENVDSSQKNIVFIAWAEKLKQPRAIASQIKQLQRKSSISHEFYIFWVPRRTLAGDTILEEEGVLGDVTISEWSLLFQPLASDLLSLELNDSFTELYLHKDPTCVFTSAKALMQIQQRHGLFPRILGKGDNAKRLADLLVRMRSEYAASVDSTTNGVASRSLIPSLSIDSLIIVERDVDFATPLLSQLTYEGLIDEIFGIHHSQAEIPQSVIGAPTQQTPSRDVTNSTSSTQNSKRKIKLDSTDQLYSQLRDANFATVGDRLKKVAHRLQSDYESRHGDKTTAELREFVSKLPGYQAEQASLKIHTGLAEEIMKQTTQSDAFNAVLEIQQYLIAGTELSSLSDRLDDLIARDAPLSTVLRLLCLDSVVNGGLRAKDFDAFRRTVLHAYGHHHLLTLSALEKSGLLYPRTSGVSGYLPSNPATTSTTPPRTNYAALRRALALIRDEVSESEPDDTAYVYSGYAPLAVRIVQCVLQKPRLAALLRANAPSTAADAASGWRGFEDALRSAKGEAFDVAQGGADRARQVLNGTGGRKTTVVFFLGGITFAEVAALRFVAAQEREQRDLLIATTGVVSGDKIVEAMVCPKPEKTGAAAV